MIDFQKTTATTNGKHPRSRDARVLAAIRAVQSRGEVPSTNLLSKESRIKPGHISVVIAALKERGILDYTKGDYSTIKLRMHSAVEAPDFEAVPPGGPRVLSAARAELQRQVAALQAIIDSIDAAEKLGR